MAVRVGEPRRRPRPHGGRSPDPGRGRRHRRRRRARSRRKDRRPLRRHCARNAAVGVDGRQRRLRPRHSRRVANRGERRRRLRHGRFRWSRPRDRHPCGQPGPFLRRRPRTGNRKARRARRADREPQHRRPGALVADPRGCDRQGRLRRSADRCRLGERRRTGRLAGGAPPAQRRRGELRPRGRRDERRRQLCVVLQLRQTPLARRTRDLHGRLLRRARRAAAAEPALGYVLPAVDGLRRHRVRLLRRDLLRVSRGCRCRRARLGRAARAEELPGRRHHQGVRRPRCRRWLDADTGLRPPRRRGGGRARAQPHRCRVGVGCAVGSGLVHRHRRCASRLASHPDDHVHAHSGPDDGGRRLQRERTRVVGPAGHIHDLRRVQSCVTALST